MAWAYWVIDQSDPPPPPPDLFQSADTRQSTVSAKLVARHPPGQLGVALRSKLALQTALTTSANYLFDQRVMNVERITLNQNHLPGATHSTIAPESQTQTRKPLSWINLVAKDVRTHVLFGPCPISTRIVQTLPRPPRVQRCYKTFPPTCIDITRSKPVQNSSLSSHPRLTRLRKSSPPASILTYYVYV